MEQYVCIYGKSYLIDAQVKPVGGDEIICINKYSMKHGDIKKCDEGFSDMVNWNKLVRELKPSIN